MTKQKKSFFEKVTGIRRVTQEEPVEDTYEEYEEDGVSGSYISSYEEEDNYEFPANQSISAVKSSSADNGQRQNISYDQYEDEEDVDYGQTSQKKDVTIEPEGQLTIDVYQTDEDIVIKSTIAGVKPEDLDVNINNDMVTIRGERKQEDEVDTENYYYQECYWGPFSRSVILPVEIIAEKAEATMKNGILTIKLPKADTTKTRKIQVRGY